VNQIFNQSPWHVFVHFERLFSTEEEEEEQQQQQQQQQH
jgi:hypothetical protein